MDKLTRLLQSRKFWAFAAALVGLVSASLQNDGVFSAEEIQAISGLVIGYIFSVAYEDGKYAEAEANKTELSK